jgi:superfamily I DNA/RNA helicase
VQEAAVANLHALGASVCVVGDDDQTLYQWHGSDVGNILSFNVRYTDVTRVHLEENFRSSEGVVAVASRLIKRVVRRLPKEMKATTAQDFAAGDIVALLFDTPEEEAAYIAKTCKASGDWIDACRHSRRCADICSPRDEMCVRREPAHVDADLGDDDVGAEVLDARDRYY